MAIEKKQQEEKEQEKWNVQLAIINELQPPQRVLSDGETTLDMYEALALILNNQEKLKKLLD